MTRALVAQRAMQDLKQDTEGQGVQFSGRKNVNQ